MKARESRDWGEEGVAAAPSKRPMPVVIERRDYEIIEQRFSFKRDRAARSILSSSRKGARFDFRIARIGKNRSVFGFRRSGTGSVAAVNRFKWNGARN